MEEHIECDRKERADYDLKDFVQRNQKDKDTLKKERRVSTKKLRGDIKQRFSFEHKFENGI